MQSWLKQQLISTRRTLYWWEEKLGKYDLGSVEKWKILYHQKIFRFSDQFTVQLYLVITTLNPTLFDSEFHTLQLLLKPFLRKLARNWSKTEFYKAILHSTVYSQLISRKEFKTFPGRSWEFSLMLFWQKFREIKGFTKW